MERGSEIYANGVAGMDILDLVEMLCDWKAASERTKDGDFQKSIEIGEASLFAYLYPLFSTPLAVVWLGEKITPMFIVGAVVITIGVVIAEIKKRRYNSISNKRSLAKLIDN